MSATAPRITLTRGGKGGSDTATEWLIYKMLPVGFSVIYGAPGGAKTFVTLFFSLLIASGKAWRGHKTKRRTVIYLYGEGNKEAIERRIKAGIKELGLTQKEANRLQLFHAPIPLLLGNSAEPLMEDILKQITAQVEESGADMDGALVIVDTVARGMEGDENSTPDMAAFIRLMDKVRMYYSSDTEHASVWGVHHTNKLGDLRGNSSLFGALDCLLRVKRDRWSNDKRCAKVTLSNGKQKDGRDSEVAILQLREIVCLKDDGSVLLDDEGQDATTCVISYEHVPTAEEKLDKVVLDFIKHHYEKPDADRLSKHIVEGSVGGKVAAVRDSLARLKDQALISVEETGRGHFVGLPGSEAA